MRKCVLYRLAHILLCMEASELSCLWWPQCCVFMCVCVQEECQLLSRAQWRRRGFCWPSTTVQLAAKWRLTARPITSWPPSKNRWGLIWNAPYTQFDSSLLSWGTCKTFTHSGIYWLLVCLVTHPLFIYGIFFPADLYLMFNDVLWIKEVCWKDAHIFSWDLSIWLDCLSAL